MLYNKYSFIFLMSAILATKLCFGQDDKIFIGITFSPNICYRTSKPTANSKKPEFEQVFMECWY